MSQEPTRRERLDLVRRAAIERAARARLNANHVRTARAALQRELAYGPSRASYDRAAEVIAEPPEWAKTWPVGQMLAAVRGMGVVRVARCLEVAEVGAGRPLGELSEAQRGTIVEWLCAGARPREGGGRRRVQKRSGPAARETCPQAAPTSAGRCAGRGRAAWRRR